MLMMTETHPRPNSKIKESQDVICERCPFAQEMGTRVVSEHVTLSSPVMDTPSTKSAKSFEDTIREILRDDPEGFDAILQQEVAHWYTRQGWLD